MALLGNKWKREADRFRKTGKKLHFLKTSGISDSEVMLIISEFESSDWVLDQFDATEVFIPGDESAKRVADKKDRRVTTYYFLFRRPERSSAKSS